MRSSRSKAPRRRVTGKHSKVKSKAKVAGKVAARDGTVKPTVLKRFLHEIAVGAGKILLKHYRKVHQIERKVGAGIVTEADKNAEAYLLKQISRKFPKSSIITEESGEFSGDSLCWVIDPLDGTSNYAHGFPWFCVSIGVYQEGRPLAGLIYQPVNGELFYAETGKGATLNGKKIQVSKTSEVQDALLGTGFYYSTGERLHAEMKIFGRIQEKALGVRRPGSAALDMAYVAAGRYDGFWERGLSSWDVAAGMILVTEAGGTVTGYSGRATTMHDAEVVATNGQLHSKVLELIQG